MTLDPTTEIKITTTIIIIIIIIIIWTAKC